MCRQTRTSFPNSPWSEDSTNDLWSRSSQFNLPLFALHYPPLCPTSLKTSSFLPWDFQSNRDYQCALSSMHSPSKKPSYGRQEQGFYSPSDLSLNRSSWKLHYFSCWESRLLPVAVHALNKSWQEDRKHPWNIYHMKTMNLCWLHSENRSYRVGSLK